MGKKIKYILSLQVEGGPSVNIPGKPRAMVQAYHKVSDMVTDNNQNRIVKVQPDDLGEVEFMIVESNEYDDLGNHAKLGYRVVDRDPNGSPAEPIRLEQAHLLMSSSLISLLGRAPNELKFTNKTGIDTNVEILVGCKAIGGNT